MTAVCAYPNCDCAVSFLEGHKPSDFTECPRSVLCTGLEGFEPIGHAANRVVKDLAAKYGYGLSAQQQALRADKVTASFTSKLMAGDEPAIISEWRRLVGDPGWVREDLTGKWAPEFGSYAEPFIRDWHARKTGIPFTRAGEGVVHPTRPWYSCTLDAYRETDDTVVDIKYIGQWRKLDDVLRYHIPQMIGQRACVGAKHAALLVVHGGAEPVEYPIEIDPDYEKLVWERVDEFWRCVETLTPPVDLPPALAPVKPEKTYDMRQSNAWAHHAAVWLQNIDAGRLADGAAKEIKRLFPDDAVRATGHGLLAIRDKAGRISLRRDAS